MSNAQIKVGILLDAGSVITLVVRLFKLHVRLSNSTHWTWQIVSDLHFRIRCRLHGSKFLTINPSFAAKDLGVDPALIDYPANMTLDVLIGMDNAKLCHPTSITTPNTVPGLVLGKTNIGHVIFGTHQSFTRRSSTSTGHYRVTSYGAKAGDISSFRDWNLWVSSVVHGVGPVVAENVRQVAAFCRSKRNVSTNWSVTISNWKMESHQTTLGLKILSSFWIITISA